MEFYFFTPAQNWHEGGGIEIKKRRKNYTQIERTERHNEEMVKQFVGCAFWLFKWNE